MIQRTAWDDFLERIDELPIGVEFVPLAIAMQCGSKTPYMLISRAVQSRIIRWTQGAILQEAKYVKTC
ncbi:MAG: hypothetical protein JO353_12995 [Phycisphaerae bacterium]|nr:hypothetical protein [Phycisphaerae bacterium]